MSWGRDPNMTTVAGPSSRIYSAVPQGVSVWCTGIFESVSKVCCTGSNRVLGTKIGILSSVLSVPSMVRLFDPLNFG